MWFVGKQCVGVVLLGLLAVLVGSLSVQAGETEKWVQNSLNTLGYDVGAADGKLGERTIGALKDFQTKKSLSVTGKVDRATVRALKVAVRCDTKAYKTETEERLFSAVLCGDLAYMTALLQQGADPKETTKSGQTPLMMAGWMGRTDFVKPLVEAGVEIDHVAKNKYTALMFAAATGNTETVRALLAAGADRYTPRDGRETAASAAKQRGHDAALELVKLEFEPEFRACVSKVTTPLLDGTPIKLLWLSKTGEMHMRYPNPPTLFTGTGMPRYVLGLVDSLLKREDRENSLLKSCEITCGSYCNAQ